MNEALSAGREDIVSYLPANQADAAHHLPKDSVDRGLDIHFRLVRHDNFQPMFKNVQGLLKERAEGSNLAARSSRLEISFWVEIGRNGHSSLMVPGKRKGMRQKCCASRLQHGLPRIV